MSDLSHEAPGRREVAVYEFREDTNEGIREFDDIWDGLWKLLRHWKQLNRDEMNVRAQQHGIIRDGCFLMPSPFGQRPDRCSESFLFNHRVFYKFQGQEEYFWITSLLDRGYALASLYFPARHTAVSLYPGSLTPSMLNAFDRMRREVVKPRSDRDISDGTRTVVIGFPHFMHMLWNELPAVEAVLGTAIESKIDFIVTYQPFGPMVEIFPELRGRVAVMHSDESRVINHKRMIVAIGSRRITKSLQRRILSVAARNALPSHLEASAAFRDTHRPIFWISIKPPKRTPEHQAQVLSEIIYGIKARYPGAGILLNGVSYPWDFPANTNYGPGFEREIGLASTNTSKILDEILTLLPDKIQRDTRIIHNISVCDEIVWGSVADYYFSHGGTMQNKIGWIHNIPGIMHSNSKFVQAFGWGEPYVVDGPTLFSVPSDLIIDDSTDSYSQMEIERKDMNYRFRSVFDVLDEIIRTYESVSASK